MEFGRGEYGEIRIHNEVITAIARRATLEVEGVEKIATGFKKSLLSFLGKKRFSRGIFIERTHENEVKITISIIVKFGANIPEVANRVQSNVKKALEQVAGITPLEVNVEVEGLEFEEKVKEIIEEIEEKRK